MAKKRILSAGTSTIALQAAEPCRAAAVQVLREAPISSDAYRRASELIDAIDALAAALTGHADHFHRKPHSVG